MKEVLKSAIKDALIKCNMDYTDILIDIKLDISN